MGLHSSQGRIPLSAFRATGARKVTIVGFGGYLKEALAQTWLDRVCCCDYLAFDPEFRRHKPYPFQIYEEASQRMEVIANADIVCLSASTLCNGDPSRRTKRPLGSLPRPLLPSPLKVSCD